MNFSFFFLAFIEPIFSWRPVITLSRLAYCAFLCHGGLQLYSVATARTPFYGSIFNLIWLSLGDISMSFFLALILSLTFESPILRLEKLLLHRDTPVDHKKVKVSNRHDKGRLYNHKSGPKPKTMVKAMAIQSISHPS